MALPKLNTSPKYETVIPSTGNTVRFRPYLVKEEKVLLMAFEQNDPINESVKQLSIRLLRFV